MRTNHLFIYKNEEVIFIIGRTKLLYKGKIMDLSQLTKDEHKQFEICTKKAIAKAIGKKVDRIIEK